LSHAINTQTLVERSRVDIAGRLPPTYRYFKTDCDFREPFDGGMAYLRINVVTHSRGVYWLAFYLSTRVDSLQERISSVLSEPRQPIHYDLSISCYSVNIGPKSPHWPYPFTPNWSFVDEADFGCHVKEIGAFISDLAMPFLTLHRTPEAVRQTLVDNPGHAINLEPYKQILVASLMHGDRGRLVSDIDLLEKRYAGFVEPYRKRFKDVRDRVLQHASGA
jgi:hypothetical protein